VNTSSSKSVGGVAPILVGYRATGKTTVAATLARRFGWQGVDADDVFEQRHPGTIAEFIATQGEPAFRQAEAALLQELVPQLDVVLATGGGVVLREDNRRLLRRTARPIIWLTASAAAIRQRLAADPATAQRRPALAGGDVLDEVEQALAGREALYREVADIMFDTETMPPEAVGAAIAAWLTERLPAAGGPEAGGES
jgi:shikimate kinase